MYSISYWPKATWTSHLSGQELKGLLLQLELLTLRREPSEPRSRTGVWPCRWEWGDNLHKHLLTPFVLIYRSLSYKLEAFLSAAVSLQYLLTTGPKPPSLLWFLDQYQHSEQSETAGNQTSYIPCCDQILPQKTFEHWLLKNFLSKD